MQGVCIGIPHCQWEWYYLESSLKNRQLDTLLGACREGVFHCSGRLLPYSLGELRVLHPGWTPGYIVVRNCASGGGQ